MLCGVSVLGFKQKRLRTKLYMSNVTKLYMSNVTKLMTLYEHIIIVIMIFTPIVSHLSYHWTNEHFNSHTYTCLYCTRLRHTI